MESDEMIQGYMDDLNMDNPEPSLRTPARPWCRKGRITNSLYGLNKGETK